MDIIFWKLKTLLAAFEICKSYKEKIHLLLTDVIMPQMSGKELSEKIVNFCPDLKTVFISGYTENTIVHHGVLDEGVNFISKPYSSDLLLKRIRKVLDK